MSDVDGLIQRALVASGTPVEKLPTDEKKILQRRIKNQRRELKRMHVQLRAMDLLVRNYSKQESITRANAYRHAAKMAESFWFGGRRAAAYIRKWI